MKALAVVFCLVFSAGAVADDPARPAADRLDAIVAGLEGLTPALSGLQLVTLKARDIDISYAAGSARIGGETPVPLARHHKVRVASISKLVAAIGLMRLVEGERLKLDGDVSFYLGWKLRNPSFPSRHITLRQLLSHTSSIRDTGGYFLPAGESFRDFFLEGSAHYKGGAHFASGKGRQPGRYFSYANLNFGLIAAVIETISGQRFDRFMTQQVLEPLGLSASFRACDISDRELATLYRKGDTGGNWQPSGAWRAQVDGDELLCHYGAKQRPRGEPALLPLAGYWPGENPSLFSPQGGLRASAEDLAVIMKMLLNEGRHGETQILQPANVRKMLAPAWTYDGLKSNGDTGGEGGPVGLMTSYGLSVHRADMAEWGLSDKPQMLYGHLGEAYGLLGGFWFDPVTKDGLIALITGTADDPAKSPQSTSMGTSPLYRVEEEILRWWLAQR